MSVGPLGMIGSAAGTPLSQAKGTDVDKAADDVAAQVRRADSDRNAENASGIGETEQDEEASDRDADGRRLLERNSPSAKDGSSDNRSDDPRSKDASGQRGNQLDVSV